MNAIAALHNAAREYCESRHAHWCAEYSALVASGRHQLTNADGSYRYTDASYRIFPRYNVLEAIRVEVERFVPSDFETIEVARGLIEAAAWSAESELTSSTSSIATAAMTDEREAFAQFVARSTQAEWSTVKVLPFRRVLGAPERDRLSHDFEARWGVWYGGYCDRPPREGQRHITLHVQWVDAVAGREETLRALLRSHGITRVISLCELGDSREEDLSAATFFYGSGGEAFWFDEGMEWMIYASHESSITFGGEWLVTAVSGTVPDIHHYDYQGWQNPPDG